MIIPTITEIKEDLKEGIISRHPRIRNFAAGSMLDILDEIIAIQANLMYQRIDKEVKNISILTAEGSYLDALVVDRLPEGRQDGAKATGHITFSCNDIATVAIPVPLGTKCLAVGSDGTRVYFETTQTGSIGIGENSVVLDAQAVEAGIAGNVAEYAINQLAFYSADIDLVENTAAFTGGTDEEDDDDLRNRYYYAVLATGTATSIVIEEHLTDLEDISEAHVFARGNGDLEVIVDYSGGTGTDSTEINDVLEENVAAGITCRGKLGATIVSGTATNHLSDSSGGKIYVRATSNVLGGEAFTLNYFDDLGRIRLATITIPINTIIGDVIEADLLASTDRACYIDEIFYSGSNSYDILIGLGDYPYLYLLPRDVLVNVNITITKTSTAPSTIGTDIQSSIEDFLNDFAIGEDLEWSDLFLNIYIDYTTSIMQTGIDNISVCSINGDGSTISTPGSIINIDEDERIRAGTVTVTVV
jgi:uncharacterized phage protein gp47/JayE